MNREERLRALDLEAVLRVDRPPSPWPRVMNGAAWALAVFSVAAGASWGEPLAIAFGAGMIGALISRPKP